MTLKCQTLEKTESKMKLLNAFSCLGIKMHNFLGTLQFNYGHSKLVRIVWIHPLDRTI